MNPPNASDHLFSRRAFIKTSAFSVGSIAFLGNGVALANNYSNAYNLWSEDFKWGVAGTVEIPGDLTDDAADVCYQAIRKRVEGDPTTSPPLHPESPCAKFRSEKSWWNSHSDGIFSSHS